MNMDGTAVLLALRPPDYASRVLIAGGTSQGANWTAAETDPLASAEWIDLSAGAPGWQALPDMNVARRHVSSVLLPDGRVLILVASNCLRMVDRSKFLIPKIRCPDSSWGRV